MKSLYALFVLTALSLSACTKRTPDGSNTEPPELLPIETKPLVFKHHTIRITHTFRGYLYALPEHYHQHSLRYPLLLSFHGSGQTGPGDSSSLFNKVPFMGLPLYIQQKTFPANYVVDGKNFAFVVVAPQFITTPTTEEVWTFINYVIKTYRVDTSRIYLTGVSTGGVLAADAAAAAPQRIAAIVPVGGVPYKGDTQSKAVSVGKGNVPTWVLHNKEDKSIPTDAAQKFVEQINLQGPTVPARLTLFEPSGSLNHDAWTRGSDPAYVEEGKNVYQWMLQYHR